MLLSDKQLEYVEAMIMKSGLRNEQLKIDLLDHVACEIEEQIQAGKQFDLAVHAVFKEFSPSHIRRIEFEVAILTTEIMQKRTKIIGIIGLVITIIGSTMKMLHLAGSATTLAIGVAILGIGFFGSNAMDMIRNLEGVKGKVVQVIGALGALSTLSGGMFKLLHLPGALDLLMLGPFLLLIYFSFSTYLRTKTVE